MNESSAANSLSDLALAVRDGLLSQPRTIDSAFFYDTAGSALFEEITRLPEYYLTRTEEQLLARVAADVALAAKPHELVELGSGASPKIRILLDALVRIDGFARAVLLDINASDLERSARALARDYPGVALRTVQGDFRYDLPRLGPGGGRLFAFLGSTLGNLHPRDVPAFFHQAAAVMAPGDFFLLGIDLVKDPRVLEAAYNDSQGVTARFNLNVLRVLNASFGADFDLGAFEHVAFYDAAHAWIEMRLRAVRAAHVSIPGADLALDFAAGDWVRTEISCKYTRTSLESRLQDTGLEIETWHTDANEMFASVLLRRC